MAYGSLPSFEDDDERRSTSSSSRAQRGERSPERQEHEVMIASEVRSSEKIRTTGRKKYVAIAVVGAMCVAGLSAGSSSSSPARLHHQLGDEAAVLTERKEQNFQPSKLARARVAMASLGKKNKQDWHWEHIGNGYYCHSNAKYICEFWGSPPPPAYPFPPQMPNPPPPPSPAPPPMSPDVPSPPPPPHPMPPPLCASEAFNEDSCTDEVVVKKCTSKVSENNNNNNNNADAKATPQLGEEKCEDVKVPVLGYCSMQSALHKIQCQVDQTPSAHLAQSLENLCTELPAKIDAVANFTMSRMFPTDPNVLAEAFNSRFAASATASLGGAAHTSSSSSPSLIGAEEMLDIFDPDNEHVFRDSIRKLLRGEPGVADKNSKGHEIAPLGRSAHQLGEQALIATLGGRETCFSVPVDTFPHHEMSGQFEMEWPQKLHASEYRPSMFRAQLLSPEFVSCITMNKFEIPMEVARGIVDTYRTYFKPIITKSLAQVNDATCGNNNQMGRSSRMGKNEASQSKDSIEKIKAFTEEGLAGAAKKKTVVGRSLLSSSLEEKTKPKTYLRTTTQIPTVDLRGAADIIQREANMGGSVDHASLVEERIMLKINNLRAQFQKDPLQDKAFTQKKKSEAEKKHSSRSLLNVDNYNEAMESARMSFTNALKNTRNVDYEAELATSINFKASFKAANTMFKHGDLFDLTDTGPPVINKEEMISLGVPGVYMKTNLAARFRMPYYFKADVPGEINFHVKGDVRYKIKVSNNTAAVEFLGSTIQADPEDITSSVVGSLQLGTSVRLDEFVTAVCVGDLCTGPMLAMQQDAYVGFDTFDTNGEVSSEDETPTCYEGPGGLETTFVEWDYDASAKAQCVASADGAAKGVGSYLQVPKSPMGVYMTTLNGQAQSIWHDYHLDSGDGHFFMDELFHTCAKEDDPDTYVDACDAAYLGELPMKPTKSARKAAKLAMKHHRAHSSTLKNVNVPKPTPVAQVAKPAAVAQAKPAAVSKPSAAQQQQAKPVVVAAATTVKPAAAAATKTPTVVTAKAAPVRPDGVYEKKPDGMMRLVATERKTPEQELAEKKNAEEAKKAAETKVAAAEKKVQDAKNAADVKKANVQSKIAADQVNAATKVMNDVRQQQQKQQQQQQKQQQQQPKQQLKQQQSNNNIKMTPINEEAKNLEKRLDSIEASMGREELEKNLQAEKLARGIAIPDLPTATTPKVASATKKPTQAKKPTTSSVISEISIDDIAAEIADEASMEGA
ncbi:unnamed protein product [Bathycoccus prasinos]